MNKVRSLYSAVLILVALNRSTRKSRRIAVIAWKKALRNQEMESSRNSADEECMSESNASSALRERILVEGFACKIAAVQHFP